MPVEDDEQQNELLSVGVPSVEDLEGYGEQCDDRELGVDGLASSIAEVRVVSVVAESYEKVRQDSVSGCASRVVELGCKRSVLLAVQVMLVCVTLPRGEVWRWAGDPMKRRGW